LFTFSLLVTQNASEFTDERSIVLIKFASIIADGLLQSVVFTYSLL